MWADRIIASAGDYGLETRAIRIRAFEMILAIGLMAELWRFWRMVWLPEGSGAALMWIPILGTAACPVVFFRSWRQVGLAGIAVAQLALIWGTFPHTANHSYLGLYLVSLLAALDTRRDAEQQLLVRSACWLAMVVFFYAGVQKLVHGYYVQGTFLSYYLSAPHFQSILGSFFSESEYARILSYTEAAGQGPFLTHSPLLLIASNIVWVGEIVIAGMLAFSRTRWMGVVAALALVGAIEVGAREFFFGAMYANLLLLLLPWDWNRHLVPICAVIYAWFLLLTFGWGPRMFFQ